MRIINPSFPFFIRFRLHFTSYFHQVYVYISFPILINMRHLVFFLNPPSGCNFARLLHDGSLKHIFLVFWESRLCHNILLVSFQMSLGRYQLSTSFHEENFKLLEHFQWWISFFFQNPFIGALRIQEPVILHEPQIKG